jgi:3-oxoacyl-[acyl-carrier protein] reductase
MRRALVTGGSGTIGAAICRALATAGHHVLVHANRNADAAAAVAASIEASGGRAEVTVFDVTDPASVEAAVTRHSGVAPIQILVNNAGYSDDAPFVGMTQAQWHGVIDVTLHGFFNVTRPLLMPMIRARWGRIVNISSVAAIVGNRGQANYAAAKAGVVAAAKSLAQEVARKGVTVNTVAPGIIESSIARSAFTDEQVRALVPMQRMGLPMEVAAVVVFLTSDAASYISGTVVSVNGAMYS